MEMVKLVTCLLVILNQLEGSTFRLLHTLRREVVGKPFELLKLSVPSLLYMIQNNLLYFALSNLDATPYQVCYQLKILTSAVFSVILLGKQLTTLKWISLVILTAGVVLTKASQTPDIHSTEEHHNSFLGFISVLLASMTSGFAGVYFEKVLKGSQATLWLRNVQMGVCSVALGFGTVLLQDGAIVREKGYFHGYNGLVASVILMQALGGLVVAVVVKYADNILKGFAASFSIITSCILEIFFFDFHPTLTFFFGALLVNLSMVLYSRDPKKKRGRIMGRGSSAASGGSSRALLGNRRGDPIEMDEDV